MLHQYLQENQHALVTPPDWSYQNSFQYEVQRPDYPFDSLVSQGIEPGFLIISFLAVDDSYWQNGWTATSLGDVAFWFNRMLWLCQEQNKTQLISEVWSANAFAALTVGNPVHSWRKTLLCQGWFCFTDLFQVSVIVLHSVWLPCVCNTLISLRFSHLMCVQRGATRTEMSLLTVLLLNSPFWMIGEISAVWLTSC